MFKCIVKYLSKSSSTFPRVHQCNYRGILQPVCLGYTMARTIRAVAVTVSHCRCCTPIRYTCKVPLCTTRFRNKIPEWWSLFQSNPNNEQLRSRFATCRFVIANPFPAGARRRGAARQSRSCTRPTNWTGRLHVEDVLWRKFD